MCGKTKQIRLLIMSGRHLNLSRIKVRKIPRAKAKLRLSALKVTYLV